MRGMCVCVVDFILNQTFFFFLEWKNEVSKKLT